MEIAKPAIPVAGGVLGAVLLPDQLQRHSRPLQLAMDRRPVGLRAFILGLGRRPRIEEALQRLIIEARGSGQIRPARRALRMHSTAAVGLTPRLAAILRLDR